jgi:molybdopterin converting factor small subunit
MSVDIELSSIFAKYTHNQVKVKVEGKTVGECLRNLAGQYPDFKKIILDKNGDLVPSFDIFVNGESTYPHTMAYPVKNGDKLNIVLLIYGG